MRFARFQLESGAFCRPLVCHRWSAVVALLLNTPKMSTFSTMGRKRRKCWCVLNFIIFRVRLNVLGRPDKIDHTCIWWTYRMRVTHCWRVIFLLSNMLERRINGPYRLNSKKLSVEIALHRYYSPNRTVIRSIYLFYQSLNIQSLVIVHHIPKHLHERCSISLNFWKNMSSVTIFHGEYGNMPWAIVIILMDG